ncbi:fimbrial chaperone protein [Variovorax boronicumulans]|uniref:Fimbrial chaperone protein n=1 Tax=Variovorax boronicumulans TaxID=436515 RepID=A0AAW8CW57_9BURK|nr:molecular chaperone [Variovorax boronicumulans]MDP9894684.1 fimbrial chaperone protein [Variovorax boronicumulans]MDQ0054503.1 fimbrial chaperone protein [Variovorax boronicumulans]
MCTDNCFRWAFAVLLMLGLQWPAGAGVTLGGTRVILGERDREASIPAKNTGTSPYVVQAWIDAGEGKNKTPLLVTPPLSRLDPGMENILRIMRVQGELPADRESVFWLNVKEIPEKPKEENVLQIAVRSRIKLFYRPSKLVGKSEESRAQLKWAVSAGTEGQGAMLKVGNPTAYHVTFTALNINSGQQLINADMVPPFGEMTYPLTAVKAPQAIQVNFATLNDYGGETPEERVQVPAGAEPVAVKAELVPQPAPSADGGKR